MIVVAALALVAATSAPAFAGSEEDIVVVGRRIATAELTLTRDSAGRGHCSLSRSSGDPRIDTALCRRAARCLPRRDIDPGQVEACIARQKDKLTAEWRRGART